MCDNLLDIKDLYVEYVSVKSLGDVKQTVHAVNGVNLSVKRGEILALAGESGCGKSTLARAVLRLEDKKSGEILFNSKDIYKLSKSELKNYRKSVQMIFQNPYSSLNPKMKIIDTLKEPLDINTNLSEIEKYNVISDTVKKVGLDIDILNKYPHEFSGGQRQRIAIARALVLNPEFIIADEPVSALDVSIQAQIINLLRTLKKDFNFTFILITHDMSVIRYLADRVAIMYLGEIVECGAAAQIFASPKHPYTKALLSAVPKLSEKSSDRVLLSGDLPSPTDLPSGCKFHTRCPHCMDVCKSCSPSEKEIFEGHFVKCFLYLNR
ncbi:MAG: ABC transporter ATP-binding protein [Candidatus Gastranaerophilaceae bacterium]|nr:ABC transporter ATP-binding protein [Candidatus Gastranaerophilaceae bacterium]